MKRLIVTLVAATFALTAMTASIAAPKKMAPKMAKTMTCPACKMAMPMKKTAMMSVAVKTPKGTYYCCSTCPAAKAHMKKPMAKMSTMKKTM
jgi:hypothetical protein